MKSVAAVKIDRKLITSRSDWISMMVRKSARAKRENRSVPLFPVFLFPVSGTLAGRTLDVP